MLNIFKDAFADLSSGLRKKRVWMALAAEDISDQHRRTALGPVWLLLNYLAFAATFIIIMQQDAGIPNYMAHVAIGLLVWFYMMETINAAVILFAREEAFIRGTTLPLSVYVLRLTTQALIRASYAAVGCLGLLLLSGVGISVAWLWSVLAILIIMAATPAVIIIFAFLGAYFPDSQFIVANVMRVGMFLTPVFWAHTGSGGARGVLYYYNPFTYFLEIVRVPIVSGDVPVRSLLFCAGLTLGAWIIGLFLIGRLRRDVVFVL
jgi:ABC-type polysaccharide/polyol phosphate export permease